MIPCLLLERVPRAPGIESFRLRPGREVRFAPGQYVRVLLEPAHPGNRELNKFLSLSCAPGKGHLEVTKRLSDSLFSRRLHALAPGDEVAIDGPLGNCTLRDADRRVVFLAGGIGITPVISIVEYAAAKRPDLEMDLFWSNRRLEDFAFRKELSAWAEADPRLRLHLFLTAGEPPDDTILAGRITAERIASLVREPSFPTYFAFGPPPMVEAMRGVCAALGVPEGNVRSESFAGA